jgi:hypothetical protein
MKNLIPMALLFLATVSYAQSTSQLYDEFLQREQTKLSQTEGNVMQFLKGAVQYEVRNILQLEVLGTTTSFVIRDRNGDICFGDATLQALRCKNEIGITSSNYDNEGAATLPELAANETAPALYNDYLKRDQTKFSLPETAAIQYLKSSVSYEVRNVIELEILTPPTTFVFRDRSGDICFGDISKRLLRCKNEIGITGVTYQGDGD